MNSIILFALFCVAYSVPKKCSQIEYEKFGKFNESFSKSYKLPRLLKRFDDGDLVLEFPVEEHDDDMITRNYLSFPPTVVLSRQDKRPVYLMHDPSKPEVANITTAEFIDSLHVCKKTQDRDSE